MIEILPVTGLPEIRPGNDVAAMLAERANLLPNDILVITQKIISKAANLFVDLGTVIADEKATSLARVTGKDPRLVAVILRESVAIIRAGPGVLITRHCSGCVMANAGIDQSNLGGVEGDIALLLPRDPDAYAARIRADFAEPRPAIVISDSFGRPWRLGVVNFAIGVAGLPAIVDQRGMVDRDERILEVTQIGFADQIASAAGLAMGEAGEGVPAAIVRGLKWDAPDRPASSIIRAIDEDLFQ